MRCSFPVCSSSSVFSSLLLLLSRKCQSAVICICQSNASVASSDVSVEKSVPTDEQKLLSHLMNHYEKAVRPIRNSSDSIVVKLGLTLTNIFDMDEKNQVLTINVWIDQEWKDELLTWDPESFAGIHSIRIPCDLIWLPDILLYNNADDYSAGYMRSRAIVYFDGTVFWPPPAQLRSTCKMDVTYFPFDSQHCYLKFGSWTYHGFQVDVVNRYDNIDLTNYFQSGEFILVHVFQKRRVIMYTCCPEPYPDVTFFIHIRRKTLFYMYNVVFPCMMMSALTLLVFCLPPDSGEKIALGITVLLAFSVFVLTIAEMMPETSDSIPLIGIYLTSVIGMTSISVVMTVIVLNLHHRGPFHKKVSSWFRWLVLDKLRRFLCMESPPTNIHRTVEQQDASLLRRLSVKCTVDSLQDELSRDMEWFDRRRRRTPPVLSTTNCDVHPMTTIFVDPPPSQHRDVLDTLQLLISRQELDDECEQIANEWRQMAQVVDRLLFWVLLIATVAITLVLLVIIPLSKQAMETDRLDESQYGLS